MNLTKSLTIAMAVAAAGTTLACPFCKAKTKGIFIGETVLMGNGTARSWIEIGDGGKPLAVGVTFNELALTGLPEQTEEKMPPEFTIKMPKEAAGITPFDHLGVNWNPNGHPPKEIYGAQHFDFHFYTIPTTERSQITLKGDNLKLCQTKPETKMMPAGYMYGPNSEEPYMGAHWIDTASPELRGNPFTSTFIYGSYNAKVIFYEPMITKDMIESKEAFSAPIKLPEEFAVGTNYPTEYTISYDAVRKEHTVALRKFVGRESVAQKAAAKQDTKAASK